MLKLYSTCAGPLVAALPLIAGLLAPPIVSAASLFSWNNSDGGSFQDSTNWISAVSGTPGPTDGAAVNLGPSPASLTNPIQLNGDIEIDAFGVVGGQADLDLNGFDALLNGSLGVFPNDPANQPILTILNSGAPASVVDLQGGAGTAVEVTGGGVLNLSGSGVSIVAPRAAVGIVLPNASLNDGVSTLDVDGSTLVLRSRLDIGANSAGAFVLEGAGTVSQDPANALLPGGLGVFIASDVGTTGTAVIRDAGSSLDAEGVVVGGHGNGQLDVELDAALTTTELSIGALDDSTGTATFSSGASVDVSGTLTVGGLVTFDNGSRTAHTGSGSLTIDGADVQVGTLRASRGALSSLTFDSGTLAVANNLEIDTGNTFVVGGNGDAAVLDLDMQNSSPATGGDAIFRDGVELGAGGVVNLNGAQLTSTAIVDSGGTINWDAGSVVLTESGLTVGQNALFGASVGLGGASAKDRLTLSDATLGVLTIDGAQMIDPEAPGGSVTLSTGGSLTVAGIDQQNGGSFDWQGGDLALTNSGLTVEEGGLIGETVVLDGTRSLSVSGTTTLVQDDLTPEQDASLTLDGGTFSTGSLAGSGFTWNSGTLQINDALTVGSGEAEFADTLVIDGSKNLSAPTLVATDGELRIAGGQLDVDAVSADGFAGGRVRFESGTLNQADDLTFGLNGISGTALDEDTVRLVANDFVNIGDTASTPSSGTPSTISSVNVESGAAVVIDGGQLTSNTMGTIDGDLHYENGFVRINNGDLRLGAGGLSGSVATPNVITLDEEVFSDYSTRPSTVTSGDFISNSGTTTIADGMRVDLLGGILSANQIAVEGTGQVHFSSGQLSAFEGILDIGTTVVGDGPAGGVLLNDPDSVIWAETLNVATGLTVDGGTLVYQGVTGLPVGFESGTIQAQGADGLRIGSDIIDAGGTSVVTIGQFDQMSAQHNPGSSLGLGTVEIGDGQTLRLDGGVLGVDAVDQLGTGTLDLVKGNFFLDMSDLFIGSSFTNPNGLALKSNTSGGDPDYYTIGLDLDIFVGTGHKTHVDNSGLRIANGGELSTWELNGGQFITVDPGGKLDVRRVVIDEDTLFSGALTAELVDVGANLTLSESASLLGDAAIADGGNLLLSTGATITGEATISVGGSLGGTGTVIGGVINSGTLAAGQSPGTLTVDGFLDQLDTGNILLEVGKHDVTQQIVHDAISVTSVLSLAGALDVLIDPDLSFDPASEGELSFTILTAEEILGRFDSLTGLAISDTLQWVIDYYDDRVDLSIASTFSPDFVDHRIVAASASTPVPEPGTAVLVSVGLMGLALRKRGFGFGASRKFKLHS